MAIRIMLQTNTKAIKIVLNGIILEDLQLIRTWQAIVTESTTPANTTKAVRII